jgi:hypothetical protein
MNWKPKNLAIVCCRSLMFGERAYGLSTRLDSGFAGIGFIGRKALTI